MTTLGEYWEAEARGRNMARADWDGGYKVVANGFTTPCNSYPDELVGEAPGFWEGHDSELSMLAANGHGEAPW